MQVFHPPKAAIERAMTELKNHGVVHPNACFNYNAENGLRQEVSYRDDDLQFRLGRSSLEEEIVDGALQMLVSVGILAGDAGYDKAAFLRHRAQIKENFKGTWTTITPVMERLMYMLTSVKRPKRLVEFGSFWGNSLAWFAGPCIGPGRLYTAEKIYGVDIDLDMTKQAVENFARLENCEAVELVGEDAAAALERIAAPIDFLYLEAKDESNKSGYLEFLRQAYDKLPRDAWVIAHDTTAWDHQEDLKDYLHWVRDAHHFAESVSFDVDRYGLELSMK